MKNASLGAVFFICYSDIIIDLSVNKQTSWSVLCLCAWLHLWADEWLRKFAQQEQPQSREHFRIHAAAHNLEASATARSGHDWGSIQQMLMAGYYGFMYVVMLCYVMNY